MSFPPISLNNPLEFKYAAQSAPAVGSHSPGATIPSPVTQLVTTQSAIKHHKPKMERKDYTEKKATIYPRDIKTQCQNITSSTTEEEDRKEQEEKQHESSIPNKNKRSFEDVLDPQHPLFEVYGLPFINHIETNHKKSRTFMKYKEQDPMYEICNDMNEDTDQANTDKQRNKASKDLNISGNIFRKALQSIKKN